MIYHHGYNLLSLKIDPVALALYWNANQDRAKTCERPGQANNLVPF
jgi:hypothetical protein